MSAADGGLTPERGSESMLATVMFTDVVGFTARTQVDEQGTIQLVRADLRAIREHVTAAGGNAVKETGDGLLAVFNSAQRAAQCAAAVQAAFAERGAAAGGAGDGSARPLEHRVALHLGEIELLDGDVYGDGVNVCARLLEHAKPHGVVLSEQVHALVKTRLPVSPKRLGRLRLKGVAERVTAYHLWFRQAQAAAPPATATELAAAQASVPSGDWYCPRCRYNLRGRSGYCPECGWEFDPALQTVSLLPWTYRSDIGFWRALLQTAWLVTRHPSVVAAEIHRPIAVSDAAVFSRAVLAVVCATVAVLLAGLIFVILRSTNVPPTIARMMVTGQIILGVVIATLFLIGASGGMAIFRASGVGPEAQNRLTAIGRFTTAPLLLLVAVLPLGAFVMTRFGMTLMLAAIAAVLILHGWTALRLRSLAVPDPSLLRRARRVLVVIAFWLAPMTGIWMLGNMARPGMVETSSPNPGPTSRNVAPATKPVP